MNFTYNQLEKIVQSTLSDSRYDHSVRVAEIAQELALIHGYVEPQKARLAGLLHDITKQMDNSLQIDLLDSRQIDYSELPKSAYHAYTAAIYVQREFGIMDKEILNAIQCHTIGSPTMKLLDKIIYVSDYLGSDYAIQKVDYQENFSQIRLDLNFGLYLKSSRTIHHLLESKKKIHPNTIQVYNQSIKN